MSKRTTEQAAVYLKDLLALSDELLMLLEAEKQALVTRNIAELNRMVELKAGVQQKISETESLLAVALRGLGMTNRAGQIEMNKIDQLPDYMTAQLHQLQAKALSCQEMVQANESLVKFNLSRVSEALNMLRREQSGSEMEVYNEEAKSVVHSSDRPDISVA